MKLTADQAYLTFLRLLTEAPDAPIVVRMGERFPALPSHDSEILRLIETFATLSDEEQEFALLLLEGYTVAEIRKRMHFGWVRANTIIARLKVKLSSLSY